MPATSGSPTQTKTVVATVAEVAGLDDTALDSGDRIAVRTPTLTLYTLNRADTSTVNNTSVLATKSGAGRFLVETIVLPGGGGFTLTVANSAALPVVNTLPDGTLVYVETVKSWFWSDAASNTYIRLIVPNSFWMAQLAWGIDPALGNDENVGSVASPLRTWGELRARLPAITSDGYTVTIAAGAAFAASDPMQWQPVLIEASASTLAVVDVVGVRTLSTNKVVATSSDEAGNVPPLIDAGFAFAVGQLIQATSGASSGATAAIVALVAGMQFRTSPWRTAAGARIAPPIAGTNVALITNPTVPNMAVTSDQVVFVMENLDVAAFDTAPTRNTILRVCNLRGLLAFTSAGTWQPDGCALSGNTFLSVNTGARVLMNLCGLNRVGAAVPDVQVLHGGFLQSINCVIEGGGLFVNVGGDVLSSRTGIINATQALTVSERGQLAITGTLYGTPNVAGSVVRTGGRVGVAAAVTPTLSTAGAGTDALTVDSQATAIPALVGGAVVPAASALTTWTQWAAAPFNRAVLGLQGPAGQESGASVVTL